MAFNPSLKVKAAREIAEKFKKKMVIVIMIDENDMSYASYGKTKELCNTAKLIADICYDAAFEELSYLD